MRSILLALLLQRISTGTWASETVVEPKAQQKKVWPLAGVLKHVGKMVTGQQEEPFDPSYNPWLEAPGSPGEVLKQADGKLQNFGKVLAESTGAMSGYSDKMMAQMDVFNKALQKMKAASDATTRGTFDALTEEAQAVDLSSKWRLGSLREADCLIVDELFKHHFEKTKEGWDAVLSWLGPLVGQNDGSKKSLDGEQHKALEAQHKECQSQQGEEGQPPYTGDEEIINTRFQPAASPPRPPA